MTAEPATLTALWAVVVAWAEPNPADGRLEDHARTRWYPTEAEADQKARELNRLVERGEWAPTPTARLITATVQGPPTRERFRAPTRSERDQARTQLALIRGGALAGTAATDPDPDVF